MRKPIDVARKENESSISIERGIGHFTSLLSKMRIQLASDLHLEFLAERFPGERLIAPAHEADALILAGDIELGTKAIGLFKDWPVPVLYVMGNHEAYFRCREDVLEALAEEAKDTSVRFLERDVVDFGGVRILGCTLWTDYCLYGKEFQTISMENAANHLNDHRHIRMRNGALFAPADALLDHQLSRAWLKEELSRPYDGTTVVVTHHAPHPLSVHPMYGEELLNAAYVSDLTELVKGAAWWCHGHVHQSYEFRVGTCRVVANPRGYPTNRHSARRVQDMEFENPNFQYAFVIDTEDT
jgi:Icc-related predicted phosphoesterase